MGMYIPKNVRMAILSYLFKEGVVVAKKEPQQLRHQAIFLEVKDGEETKKTPIHNLYVLNLMKSLRSRGLVKEKFCWRHYYWYLTNKGINVLREYLHIPANVNPATLKEDKEKKRIGAETSRKSEIDEDEGYEKSERPTRGRGGMGRGYRYD